MIVPVGPVVPRVSSAGAVGAMHLITATIIERERRGGKEGARARVVASIIFRI